MSIRQTNLALQLTGTLLACAALVSLIAGLLSPLDMPKAASPGLTTATTKAHFRQLPSIASFNPIFARALQPVGPTNAAAASAQNEVQPVEATRIAAQLVLVGTIGNSVALIRGPDGSVGLVEIGDDVNGAPVVAIRPSECDLRVNGKLTTLRIAPSPDDGSFLQTR